MHRKVSTNLPTGIGTKSDTELPGYLKSIADSLSFGNAADGSYHAHKHAKEMTKVPAPDVEMIEYVKEAREWIKTRPGTVRHNQNGSRSVLFQGDGKRAIVAVSTDGKAVIATYGRSN